ncbi:MAG: hypothetical protein AAGC68_03430 [Verrucomicrobiota bacterium]
MSPRLSEPKTTAKPMEASNGSGESLRSETKKKRVVPSTIWIKGARALWNQFTGKEKSIFLFGLLLPTLDQLARLGSLGLAMRLMSHAVTTPLEQSTRIQLCFLIFGAFAIAAVIQTANAKLRIKLKNLIDETVKRVQEVRLSETLEKAKEDPVGSVSIFLKKNKAFTRAASSGMLSLIEFAACSFMVVVLLGVVLWFDVAIGTVTITAGAVALIVLRSNSRRKKKQNEPEEEDEKVEVGYQARIMEKLRAQEPKEEAIDIYSRCAIDPRKLAEKEKRNGDERRVTTAVNMGTAVLMGIALYLVSRADAIDPSKMIWVIVFVLALRLAVAQGRKAISSWGRALGEKNALMEVAKIAPRMARG